MKIIKKIAELKKGDVFISNNVLNSRVIVEIDVDQGYAFITDRDTFIETEMEFISSYNYYNGGYININPDEHVEYLYNIFDEFEFSDGR